MRPSSKHIAATAASIAVVAAFGIGAFALAQGDATFDPQNFTSAYSKGSSNAEKGYQANPIDSDAEANRSKDDVDSKDKSAETERPTQDVLTNRPLEAASGTTAYNVTGNAQLGSVSVAGSNGESAGSGAGAGSNSAGGAVVVRPEGNNGGGQNNGANNNGQGENGNGGNSSGGGQNNGGSGEGGDVVRPNATTPDGYDTLPSDTTPDCKNPPSVGDFVFSPINNDNTSMSQVDPESAKAHITKSLSDEYAIFSGQKLDAWTVFCALDATYSYGSQQFAWACTKDEFATYGYFRVDSFPEVAPVGSFDITVSYRFNAQDSWHTQTISYEAERSCTYIVSSAVDESGNPQVLGKVMGGQTCNLLRYTESYLQSAGYMPDSWSTSTTHLLLGWKEGNQPVDYLYTPEPGRHVITAGDVAEVPAGFTVSTDFYWLDDNLQEAADGTNLCYLQRLTGFEWDALEWGEDYTTTLTVPYGVQAVDIDSFLSSSITRLFLPATTMVVHLVSTDMTVDDAFSVDPENPYLAATEDGILTSKDGTEYLGVPANTEALDVPASVTSVQLQERNSLRRIVLHADDNGELPSINLDSVGYCNIVIDDDVAAQFMQDYNAAINAQDGNTISLASNPGLQMHIAHGMLYSDDDLVFVANSGASTIKISGPHTVKQGCFDGNADVSTLVLADEGSFTFEPGSLANSGVSSIICYTNEQKQAIESQLAAAGAADAQATVAETSADGFRYYVDQTSGAARTTLLAAPADLTAFDGYMTAADGSRINVDAISTMAFADCADLTWVTLSESTTFIGAGAFSGCGALQGAFIGCADTVTMEQDAFSDCASMRFLASRAMQGNFTFTEAPGSDCVLYRPTNSNGTDGYTANFQYFTPESGVDDYATIEQADGSRILYGCANGNPWLALRSGNQLSGSIALPSTTSEIFISAFQNATGEFTINWDELPDLMFVDGSAFAYSSLVGDVRVGTPDVDHVSIASDAFAYCGITSFVSDAPCFDCASWAISSCPNLTYVRIAGGPDWSGNGYTLFSSAFYGCSALETIEFTSTEPLSLSLLGSGMGFRFDGDDFFNTDERERIHVIVPQGTEQLYLEEWLYSFLGYANYDEYYTAMYNNIMSETMREPSPVEVKEAMAAGLLDAENRLRQMLGLELVDTSSFITVDNRDGYVFQTIDGATSLIAVPENATVVDLDTAIGNAYDSVIVGERAFAGCSKLTQVVFGEKVSGIEPNAFAECDDVVLTFPQQCYVTLLGSSKTSPFRFGANVKLDIPESAQTDYLSAWPQECIGAQNEWLLADYFFDTWTDLWQLYPDEGPTADELNEAVNRPLFEQENYLRGLMGLEPITELTDLTAYIDASGMFGFGGDMDDSTGNGGNAGDADDSGSAGGESDSSDASDDDVWGDVWEDPSMGDDDLQPLSESPESEKAVNASEQIS